MTIPTVVILILLFTGANGAATSQQVKFINEADCVKERDRLILLWNGDTGGSHRGYLSAECVSGAVP